MESFEIKNLCALRGRSGLFRYVGPLRAVRNGGLYELLTEPGKRVIVRDIREVTYLGNVGVYVGANNETVSVETIIDRMYTAANNGVVIPVDISDSAWDTPADFMEEFVPGYDREKFKVYNMQKILSWYHDVARALDMMWEEATEGLDERPFNDEWEGIDLGTKLTSWDQASERVLPLDESDGIEEE